MTGEGGSEGRVGTLRMAQQQTCNTVNHKTHLPVRERQTKKSDNSGASNLGELSALLYD